jgi:CysZ protein
MLAAFTYPFRGFAHFAARPHLWKYAIVPLAVNIVVYAALAWVLWWFVQDVLLGRWIASWWTWARWMAAAFAYAAGAALLAFSFTIVGNVIAAPFMDVLAERALAERRGAALPPGGPWWAEAALAVGRQLARLVVFGAVHAALLAMWFIPVVNLLHPPVAWLVTIFFLAMEYLDYPQAADRMPFGDRIGAILSRPASSFGFGSGLLLIAIVPFLAPIALPACVMGAVLLHDDARREG